MAKISARGAKEIARWTKGDGNVLVLTEQSNGKTKLLRKPYKGGRFVSSSIVIGRRANGGPIFSDRPTLEQVDAWAKQMGFERKFR